MVPTGRDSAGQLSGSPPPDLQVRIFAYDGIRYTGFWRSQTGPTQKTSNNFYIWFPVRVLPSPGARGKTGVFIVRPRRTMAADPVWRCGGVCGGFPWVDADIEGELTVMPLMTMRGARWWVGAVPIEQASLRWNLVLFGRSAVAASA